MEPIVAKLFYLQLKNGPNKVECLSVARPLSFVQYFQEPTLEGAPETLAPTKLT